MFGIALEDLLGFNSVKLRVCGTGHRRIVVFPGMEGSGESCLQVIAKTLSLNQLWQETQLVVVDYSGEGHSSLESLVETIITLLAQAFGNTGLIFWGQSFGNILGILAADSERLKVEHFLMVSAFDSLPALKITFEVLTGRFVPDSVYRATIKPIGRYIFGPCGDQRDHPFFDALERAPGSVFGRRTSWLAHRSFAEYYSRARYHARVWLGSRDRLVDLNRQKSLFMGLARGGRFTFEMIPGSGHVVLPLECISWISNQLAESLPAILSG